MNINLTNQPSYTDKTAGLPKQRDAREPKQPVKDIKQPERDAFVPSLPADSSGIYKPPSANQASSTSPVNVPLAANEQDEITPVSNIEDILAKIKDAIPDDLLSAHQSAALQNITALIEAEK